MYSYALFSLGFRVAFGVRMYWDDTAFSVGHGVGRFSDKLV